MAALDGLLELLWGIPSFIPFSSGVLTESELLDVQLQGQKQANAVSYSQEKEQPKSHSKMSACL